MIDSFFKNKKITNGFIGNNKVVNFDLVFLYSNYLLNHNSENFGDICSKVYGISKSNTLENYIREPKELFKSIKLIDDNEKILEEEIVKFISTDINSSFIFMYEYSKWVFSNLCHNFISLLENKKFYEIYYTFCSTRNMNFAKKWEIWNPNDKTQSSSLGKHSRHIFSKLISYFLIKDSYYLTVSFKEKKLKTDEEIKTCLTLLKSNPKNIKNMSLEAIDLINSIDSKILKKYTSDLMNINIKSDEHNKNLKDNKYKKYKEFHFDENRINKLKETLKKIEMENEKKIKKSEQINSAFREGFQDVVENNSNHTPDIYIKNGEKIINLNALPGSSFNVMHYCSVGNLRDMYEKHKNNQEKLRKIMEIATSPENGIYVPTIYNHLFDDGYIEIDFNLCSFVLTRNGIKEKETIMNIGFNENNKIYNEKINQLKNIKNKLKEI